MPGRPVSQLGRISRVRFYSPMRWTVTAAAGIMGIAALIVGIRALGENLLDVLVMAVLVGLMGWITYFEAWLMETRPEGLYVRYTFGNSQVIPYDQITQVTVRVDRLQVHTTNRYTAEAAIALQVTHNQRHNTADDLVAAINAAAGLKKSSKAFFGWQTYDREG